MKKLISIILTFTLSFSMFSCTGTFATAETRDGVVQVYNNGNNKHESLKLGKSNKLNIFKKFLTISAAVGSSALISFIAIKNNIFKFFNFQTNHYTDKTTTDSANISNSNNSNWWLKSLPYVFDILILSVAAYFLHNANQHFLDNKTGSYWYLFD